MWLNPTHLIVIERSHGNRYNRYKPQRKAALVILTAPLIKPEIRPTVELANSMIVGPGTPKMKCDNCLGPLTKIHNQNYHRCPQCNCYRFPSDLASSVDPIVAVGRTVVAECPRCELTLKLGVIHDRWNVCYCENCRGFLIESGTLQVIAHELRANYSSQDDVPVAIDPSELMCARSCPACGERFETHTYCGPGNVVVDSCYDCGLTWLDHGELATIMRAPGKRPSPDSSPVVPTYTHIPSDAVAEALAETTKFLIRNALRYVVMHSSIFMIHVATAS